MILSKWNTMEVHVRLYAIFANDKITGTTYQLFNHAVQTFQDKGYHVDKLHLYDFEDKIPFFHHDQKLMESYPFYQENKERFLNADALLLVFPLYWYSVPAIMKAWLDMINGWAYKYEKGIHANPLHNIKKTFVLYASMQDRQLLEEVLHNPVENQLSETCKFIGIPDFYTYLVDNVNQQQEEDIKQHLAQISNWIHKAS